MKLEIPKDVIELDADVYDTLEISAMEFGGIGAGLTWRATGNNWPDQYAPHCLIGHINFCGISSSELEPIRDAALKRGVHGALIAFNDNLVSKILRSQGRNPTSLRDNAVSWEDYTKYGNIVRKDS